MKIILASLLLISSSAFAHTGMRVCEKLQNHGYVRQAGECRVIVSETLHFDEGALNSCEHMARYNSREALACLSTIRNQVYNPGTTFGCEIDSKENRAQQSVACLAAVPHRQYVAPVACDIKKMKRQIDGAISHYLSGNQEAMYNTLVKMQAELNTCVAIGM